MLQTEFIKNLQSNYERVLLEQKPDEKRYQYCILSRGGIRGLLSCSLRYINGSAYLYYDITSKQNVAQLYKKLPIGRSWVENFFWSYAKIKQELGRFLLDERNVLLFPDQIFQDIGSHNFSFLYLPYHQGENGFAELLEFLVERMDYEDEALVECVYRIYDQYEQNGEIYLQEKVFEDVQMLERNEVRPAEKTAEKAVEPAVCEEESPEIPEEKIEKRGLRLFGRSRKRREKEQREAYYQETLDYLEGYAVAEEDAPYGEEEYGKTVYLEQSAGTGVHKLYTPDGRVAVQLDGEMLTIGKQKGEVDFVLEKESVSRVHARIYAEGGFVYLEDLNSTNGTFKNGLRMQPYEKRRLEEGDEIRFGGELFVYR